MLPPQLLDSILQLDTAHEMLAYLECKFHDTDPIERVAETKVKTCANDEVSKGQSGSASSRATETYWIVEQASIATESPENPPTSGDGQEMYKDENIQVEMMRKRPKVFAGTCHRCREVGHKACDCRRSVDLPKCSAKEAATTIVGQTQTRGHNPCYNPEPKSRKGSERESMAVERPTNAIECVADGQKINLLREVSDDKEKGLLNVPDGPHEPQDESLKLQGLPKRPPIEGEPRRCEQQAAEGMTRSAEVIGKATDVDGKALPGRELANRARRVDEADETPDGCQSRPQQRQLYHKRSQHNENTERNIPSAHGVPLEGEWSMCASGRVRDSQSDSRRRGMGECGCIDKWSWPVEKSKPVVRIPEGYCQLGRADGMSCKEVSTDGKDEPPKLVPTTVELNNPGGSEKPRVCLGGTNIRKNCICPLSLFITIYHYLCPFMHK